MSHLTEDGENQLTEMAALTLEHSIRAIIEVWGQAYGDEAAIRIAENALEAARKKAFSR